MYDDGRLSDRWDGGIYSRFRTAMVFGLFSKDKALKRAIEKATNKLAQQQDRWGALEKLKEDSSEEALYGLCRRFGITSMKSSEDETEKNWVVDTLIEKGAMVLPPLRRYMKNATQLAFPLRVLEGIADKAQVLEVIDELFAVEKPGYTRQPEKRIDLIHWLSEYKAATDAEVVSRLAPYVSDFDENARFAAIDGIAGRDAALIAEPLIGNLLRPDEESGRIKLKIVEVLADRKIPLGDKAAQVATGLTGTIAGFAVKNGVLVAR
jgi:hypothetical protein